MRTPTTERGVAMAWTAILFSFVLVPLMILVVDGSRLLAVRNRLQTATDAACEAAAWVAADRQHYRETGETRFQRRSVVQQAARTTFYEVLAERGRVGFLASITARADRSQALVRCTVTGRVPLMIRRDGVTIRIQSVSQIRFGGG